MDLQGWDERYRTVSRAAEDIEAEPTPLVMETARNLKIGNALDLACGAGRNALWLATQGWRVTAVDGAPSAVAMLQTKALAKGIAVETFVADLEKSEFRLEPKTWDLIVICYYLQRDLIEQAKAALAPGGVLVLIVHICEPGEAPTKTRMSPGELRTHFEQWEILHDAEGKPRDAAHRRSAAEMVARKPREIRDST